DQVLSWDDDHWDEQLRGSALRRIKPWMWRRNAAAARMSEPPTI
ncbi:MAG TPA: epoxyqueuosine reductase, partial [Synechococcus sp. UBA9887]|nr:epoxyqueuosine reductase [Synechococcus sp. UBA9887]